MKKFQANQLILYLLMAIVLLAILTPFILPMILGCILALVVEPLVLRVDSVVKNYQKSLRLVVIGASIALITPLVFLLISGISAMISYGQSADWLNLSHKMESLISVVMDKAIPWVDKLGLSVDKVKPPLFNFLKSIGTNLLVFLTQLAQQAPKIILDTFVLMFSGFLTLQNKERLSLWLKENPFLDPQTNTLLTKSLYEISYSVVFASMVAGLIQMVTVMLCSLITGNSQWLFLGFITFFLSFVPVVGTSPITVTLILYAALTHSYSDLVIYLFMLLVVFTSDNVLKPKLIGNKAKIHPVLAFLSAMGGYNLCGFYGLFFGPIMLGVALVMLAEAWKKDSSS